MIPDILENLRRFAEGAPILNMVDRSLRHCTAWPFRYFFEE